MKKIVRFRHLVAAVAIAAALSSSTGCANTRLVSRPDFDGKPPKDTSVNNYFWGIMRPKDIPANCTSGGICRVIVKTRPHHVLIAAVTLGIVIPQRFEWECCANAPQDGNGLP